MRHHIIVHVCTRILVPFILLFALYVQFHGDFGPGGGFQAGVIFGAGCILYGLVFGVDTLLHVAPAAVVRAIAASGVLLYASVGFATLMAGGNYLDYSVLGATPVAGQHLGAYIRDIILFLTFATEDKPYPFGPWPGAAANVTGKNAGRGRRPKGPPASRPGTAPKAVGKPTDESEPQSEAA